MKSFTLLLFFILMPVFGAFRGHQFSKIADHRQFIFDYDGSYFISTGLFDRDGNKSSYGESEGFSLVDSNAWLRYGMGENFEVSGGLRFRHVAADYLNNKNEPLTTTDNGIESYALAGKYKIVQDKKNIWSVEASVRKTGYSNNNYANLSSVPENEVSLGDSGTEMAFGVGYDHFFTRKSFIAGALRYRAPGNELSEEVVYDMMKSWQLDSFGVGLGVTGIYSLKTDAYSGTNTAKNPQGRSPSNMFNSVDRSHMSLKAMASYAFNSYTIYGGYENRLSGTSTDQGHLLLFGLSFGTKPKKKKRRLDSFRGYDLEGEVVKTTRSGRFVRIDKGLSDDVTRGMRFDIYKNDFKGLNELVAEGVVYKVFSEAAILKITNRFSNQRIREGFTVRAQLQ